MLVKFQFSEFKVAEFSTLEDHTQICCLISSCDTETQNVTRLAKQTGLHLILVNGTILIHGVTQSLQRLWGRKKCGAMPFFFFLTAAKTQIKILRV